jgi:uncharacterized protein YidB (DUF937 family)
MSKRFPSLMALLGLVAVAGYQNREKIGEMVKGWTGTDPKLAADKALETVKQQLGDGPVATKITTGLGELVDHFKSTGHAEKAESWVSAGPNQPIEQHQMEQALGTEVIDDLVKQTGLDRNELLDRLSKALPEAVDKLTPEGRLPPA